MAGGKVKLTQTAVEKAEAGDKRYLLTDSEISGFRLIVSPSGRKSYALRYRVGGGRGGTIREPKIGEHPGMKAEAARKVARDWAAIVRTGGDPSEARQKQREAPTLSDLLDRYLVEYAPTEKKASSAKEDGRLIEREIRPALGRRKVAELTKAQVREFHRSRRDTPYLANRTLALLSKAMRLAEDWELRERGTNPCVGISRFDERKRKRFLSPRELAALGSALQHAEANGCLPAPGGHVALPISPYAVAAIRLLVLTGARKSEILGLRWNWIELERGVAHLPDSKTGEKVIHLPPAALAVLADLPRVEGNPHVIVGRKTGASLVNLQEPWTAIRAAAGLDDVRVHDLRHSFASVGAAGGLSLPIIGALLGHTQATTTQRYAHLADDPLRQAAGQIGDSIAAALSGESADVKKLRG